MKVLKQLPVTGIFFVAITLSACSTINPFTGEKEVSKTVKGAGVGARCRCSGRFDQRW